MIEFLTEIINFLYGSNISDSATCFKLINGDLARRTEFISNGFELDFEIICKILRLGYTVEEIGVNYNQRTRKDGKKIRVLDGLLALKVIFRERFN